MQNIKLIQISPSLGSFLQNLVKMHNSKSILEVGTLYGFSTSHFAQALQETNGFVMSIEKSEENFKVAKANLKKYNNVKLVLGDAQAILSDLVESRAKFDFIFIDANKSQYLNYLKMSIALLNKTGLIIADNTLFRGYVFGDYYPKKYNKIVSELRKFHEFINNLEDFQSVTLDVEDGITILQRAGI